MQRRCDHDPAAPRLRLPIVVAGNLPLLLQDAIRWAAKLYARPHLFPEITARAYTDAETRIRKRRTERLEAIVLVLIALLRRCDVRTLRVGDQRDDGLCNGVRIAKLCEATGLEPSRVVRALGELESAGYIRSVQPVQAITDAAGLPVLDEKGRQRHRGFASVRVVTPLAFQRLGVAARKLKRARAFAYTRWCRRTGRPASAVQIIGNRKALKRLVRGNRQREARLASGAGVYAAAQTPPRAPDRRRLDSSNAQREARLLRDPPDPQEPPPNERSAR